MVLTSRKKFYLSMRTQDQVREVFLQDKMEGSDGLLRAARRLQGTLCLNF